LDSQVLPRHNKVLALVTDAFGGTGGIAQYNRDFIEAVATHASVESVAVVPRVISREIQPLPDRVSHLTEAGASKAAFVRTVAGLSKSGAFDLVVCGHINLLPVAYPAAKRIGARLILLVYGAEVWERKNPIVRRMAKGADAIVSISRFTLDRMLTWAAVESDRVFILPNAIDLEAFDEKLAAKPDLELKGSPVLLTLGRMEAEEKGKGFDEIMEAMPQLIAEYPDIMYYAAGDGSDRERLTRKAKDLRIEDHVVFPGYISEEDKPAIFRAADVYVMPGRLEGFGYVFLEEVAAGTPVIGSTLDASREAMKDGQWGIVVNPHDRQALLAAIRTAIAKPEVPQRRDLEYFSNSQFRKRTHGMLDQVLGLKSTTVVS
jgi:glycosyltransferase involved in cell wall biosynthesis